MKAQPNTVSGCIFLLFALFKLLHARRVPTMMSFVTRVTLSSLVL